MSGAVTPEQIQQARAVLDHRVRWQDDGERALVMRVLEALTEQQPEPVSLAEFHSAMWGSWKDAGGHFGAVVTDIYAQFTVTRKAGA